MSFLQIASWNIEHLSGASREEKKQSAYALADHIEMAGVDIVALQEIYVTGTKDGRRRNAELDRVCEILEEHLGSAWDYEILPNRRKGDKSQLCCMLWNEARVSLAEVRKLDVPHKDDGDPLWDRAPHACKFTMLMDVWHKSEDGEWTEVTEEKAIVIVPLHMKSNYGGGTKNMRIRAKEARALCETLPEIRAMDESIVLIGDTNVLRFDEEAIRCFVEAGLVDLNNTDSPTYWSRAYGDSPFDRAFVAEDRPEFRYTRQYVLRSSDLVKHDQFLSDHFMIKISVKIYLDDGDPRPGL